MEENTNMKRIGLTSGLLLLPFLAFFVVGCYTQLETVREDEEVTMQDETEEGVVYDSTQEQEEVEEEGEYTTYPPYYPYHYYYPPIHAGIWWYDPWYYYDPFWYGYWPYCRPYFPLIYSYYYPAYYYPVGYYPRYYVSVSVGHGSTRTMGHSRGFGGTRGGSRSPTLGGSAGTESEGMSRPHPAVDRTVPPVSVSPAQPVGKGTTTGSGKESSVGSSKRKAPTPRATKSQPPAQRPAPSVHRGGNSTPKRGEGVSRPSSPPLSSPAPAPSPSSRGGGGRTGGSRGGSRH